MKEAIGTSAVFSIMMVFVGVIIALLIGSVAYSKGFKVRNRIIDIIEANGGYTDTAKIAISADLKNLGYKITNGKDCPVHHGNSGQRNDEYNYCVYTYEDSKGRYYGVAVFIQLDLPLIGDYINIPIYGESRLVFDQDIIKY